MEPVNLTPHSIVLVSDEGSIEIPPSGTIARVATTVEIEDYVRVWGLQVPVRRVVLGELSGLPDPAPGTGYIVSRVVAEAVLGRDDVFIPDDTVRDEQGRVVGCRALARVGSAPVLADEKAYSRGYADACYGWAPDPKRGS